VNNRQKTSACVSRAEPRCGSGGSPQKMTTNIELAILSKWIKMCPQRQCFHCSPLHATPTHKLYINAMVARDHVCDSYFQNTSSASGDSPDLHRGSISWLNRQSRNGQTERNGWKDRRTRSIALPYPLTLSVKIYLFKLFRK